MYCDRIIVKQLFDQCCQHQPFTTTVERLVERYLEWLHTSSILIQKQTRHRQQLINKRKSLESSLNSLHSTPYAFLTVVSAIIHQHFSPQSILSYKIEPSNLPPSTFINQNNIEINQSYTIEIPSNFFEIVFMESNIELPERYKYRFETKNREEGLEYDEYHRVDGLEVRIKVKFQDKLINLRNQISQIDKELIESDKRKDNAEEAHQNLLNFQPFSMNYHWAKRINQPKSRPGCLFQLSQCLVKSIPFLRWHVRNFYYYCLFMVVVASITSLYSPLPFVNAIVPIIGIAMVHYGTDKIDTKLWLMFTAQLLIILNSILALMLRGRAAGVLQHSLWILLLIDTFFQSAGLLLIWLMAMRSIEFDQQSDDLLNRKTIK